jgi:hypothetical protein
MYEIPNIDWKGMVEYLKPLLFNLGEFKSLETKESVAEVAFEYCNLLFHYDVQDRFISTFILDSNGIVDLNHMIQVTPTFDYYLNGNFRNYIDTLNTSVNKFYYCAGQFIVLDYIIAILNSQGLKNFIYSGNRVADYFLWLRENGKKVNNELLKIYNANCII